MNKLTLFWMFISFVNLGVAIGAIWHWKKAIKSWSKSMELSETMVKELEKLAKLVGVELDSKEFVLSITEPNTKRELWQDKTEAGSLQGAARIFWARLPNNLQIELDIESLQNFIFIN